MYSVAVKDFYRSNFIRLVVGILIFSLVWVGYDYFGEPELAEAAVVRIFITNTSTTTWQVPANWNSASNTIEVIGGGGGGTSLTTGAGGGGGGGYGRMANLSLTPGNNITIGVGSGGPVNTNGGNTWFNAASFAACVSTAVCASAEGGKSTGTVTGGAGGASATGVAATEFSGGAGGSGSASFDQSSGGGGGAGSRNGIGGTGGAGDALTAGDEAQGGGGASGDNAGATDNGVAGAQNGGDGGDSLGNASSGGTGGTSANGAAGTDGGGGGGGDTARSGGAGGAGEDWQVSPARGPGGGGGGADDDGAFTGGAGGTYGGGGGGGNTGGIGAQGIIVITYTSLDVTAPTPNPPRFTTTPANSSASQIDMVSVTVTDGESPTISYFFSTTSSGCTGGHGGNGSDNRTWNASASYSDTGLDPNKCYGYMITARDSASTPNKTSTSTASSTYTSANVPGTPTFGSITATTLVLTHAENSNPASNPTTAFAVQASSTDDATWHGKYVDASGNPSDTAVWRSDDDWDPTTINGLDEATDYQFRSKARNQDNDETSFGSYGSVTTLDVTSPMPNPPRFGTTPNNTSASTISMVSVTVTDSGSPTINYFFSTTSSGCTGGHGGTGSDNRTWNASATYEDSGLQPNQCYGYMVTARDGAATPNKTSTSTASSTYTSANVPGTPSLGTITTTTVVLTHDANSNPSSNPTTAFAVQASSTDDATWHGKYVDSTGNPSDTAVWRTDAQLDSLTINGLDESTDYQFRSKARNQDNDETSFSSYGSVTTADGAAPTPNPMTFATAPIATTTSIIRMVATTGTDLSTPIEYSFAVSGVSCTSGHYGTNGTASGWQESTIYNDTGLDVNKCYGYQVTARDSEANSGTASGISTEYTRANTPGLVTSSAVSASTITLAHDANGNPATDPVTSFVVRVSNTSPSDDTWEDKYVDGDGNPSDTEVWLTDDEIDGVVVSDLNGSTGYTFESKARNADTVETSYGSSNELTTNETPPNPLIRILDGVRIKAGRFW